MGYDILKYCDKCGKLWQGDDAQPEEICEVCKNILSVVPDEYFENPDFKVLLSKDMEQKLIQDLVLTSPNFDQYYFDNKDEIHEQHRSIFEANMAYGKAILEGKSCRPECPTCHSHNVRRISGIERGASIIGFGILSNKINKSFQCGNCGYTW